MVLFSDPLQPNALPLDIGYQWLVQFARGRFWFFSKFLSFSKNIIGEINKLQRHMTLLREEYVKLQARYVELQQKHQMLSASSDKEETFVSRMLQKIAELFEKELYSDLTIILDGQHLRAHRFVLAARSDHWSVPALGDVDELDLSDLPHHVAYALLKWTYTDRINEPADEAFLLALMKAASRYKLNSLIERCENMLMSSVTVRNCIALYTVAEEIDAEQLKSHCSKLISCYWDDFTESDFAHMSSPLLYKMFKTKSDHPLHVAIRMRREDVVFLFLIEYDSQLSVKLNEVDHRGDLPLDLALIDRQESIAETLILQKVDVNARDGNGHTLLQKAIERGDDFSAGFLIRHDAAVNETSPDHNRAPLHLVAALDLKALGLETAKSNMADVARSLLKKGANPNIKDDLGNTVFHLAVTHRNEVIFDVILEYPNLELETLNSNGDSALWLALETMHRTGNSKFAAKLLEKGSSPDAIDRDTGDSLLHRAIKAGNEEGALFLTSHGAKINHLNKKGENPLHIACGLGLAPVTTALLQKGANANQQTLYLVTGDHFNVSDGGNETSDRSDVCKQTPLHVAIRNRKEACIKAILDHKLHSQRSNDNMLVVPNFNIQDSEDQTALGLALVGGLHQVARELLAGGASVNVRNKDGLTLLHQAILHQETQGTLFLLENGADFTIKTADGKTPLQLAVEQNVAKVVEALCRRGVDMDVKDEDGNPALWLALESGREEIASILIKNGCDSDCWSPGPEGCQQTLLHRAIDENNECISCFLIRSGCDINSSRRPGSDGRGGDEAFDLQTPLHLACTWGMENVVEALLEHKANINAQDMEGKSPLHVAIINQHPGIISLVLSCKSVDLSLRDKKGQTPFTIAMTAKNNKAAQAILKIEPRAAEQYNNKGLSFLHTAIQKSDIESVLFLLGINVAINSRTNDSAHLTPLHLAVQSGSEIIIRNLLLAGANVNDFTLQKQNALHLAAGLDRASICTILIENGADFDALDDNLNNALHIAVQKGQLATVKVLLTESHINAEAVNLRGQNPVHVLAQHGKENAAAIFEFFLECMPNYPINKADAEGNTPLLLAYMNGNGTLCRAVVRAGACLGTVNRSGISIFNYQVATKQLLFRLLDLLSQEPPWSDGDTCLECNAKFGIATRKHHCRHCGRLLCSKCSDRDMPILKYNLNKPVRVCALCFDVLTLGSN